MSNLIIIHLPSGYPPEQLYSIKRDAIQDEIFEETKKILNKHYIQLNEFLVRDVTLPPTIKDAIERNFFKNKNLWKMSSD